MATDNRVLDTLHPAHVQVPRNQSRNLQLRRPHEGFADTRTLDGTTYTHCDKILIYDVKIPEVRELEKILNLAAGVGPNDKAAPVENLQIRGLIFAGTPVLSAVKLDLSGVTHGMNVKAGFDFKK